MFVEQFNPQPPKTGIVGSVKAEPQAQARKIPNFLKIAYRTPADLSDKKAWLVLYAEPHFQPPL